MKIHLNQSLPLALGLTTEDVEKLAKELTFHINRYRLVERKCLFYDNRVCHVREQMNITDIDLKEETIVNKREYGNPIRKIKEDVIYEYTKYKNTQNTADWLVNGFCRICPHIRG